MVVLKASDDDTRQRTRSDVKVVEFCRNIHIAIIIILVYDPLWNPPKNSLANLNSLEFSDDAENQVPIPSML